MRLPLKVTWKLQLVQNVAVQGVVGILQYARVTLLLYVVH